MPDQYWITGADGKEYGPSALANVVQWIRERRLIATTRVRRNDGPWVEAASLPELAACFRPDGVAAAPASAGGAPIILPSEFRAWAFIGQAWDLVKPHWLPLGAIFFIQMAIGSVPYIGTCIQFVIGGAIMVGIWRALLGMIGGRAPQVGMMFEGFDRFGEAFLAMLVSTILIGLGFIALIVPGIILAVMWIFAFPVVGETNLGFWEAMRQSAVLTEGYRWRLFVLLLANVLVILLGVLCLCIGVFVAEAVCLTSLGLAYRWLQQRKSPAGPASA
jgi:uncharacterized membrane protein